MKSKKAISFSLSRVVLMGLLVVVIFLALAPLSDLLANTKENLGVINKKDCDLKGEVFGQEDCENLISSDFFSNDNEIDKEDKATNSDVNKIQDFNSITEFAQKNNINPNVLGAIIKQETKAKTLDSKGHPIVRFECHRFNSRVKNSNLPCTIKEGDSFSRVSSETNKEAFFKAKKINGDEAIRQSSFGFAQIMGFNYNKVGYSTPEKFYSAMFKEEKQVLAFLTFLSKTNGMLEALREEDWHKIARLYNGKNYRENDYHVKLENIFNKLEEETKTA